jgi:hypothetical protein
VLPVHMLRAKGMLSKVIGNTWRIHSACQAGSGHRHAEIGGMKVTEVKLPIDKCLCAEWNTLTASAVYRVGGRGEVIWELREWNLNMRRRLN